MSDPTPLVPGQAYELTMDLDATSWRFAPGHRLRLSISHADFPNVWPSPTLTTSGLHCGGSRPSRLILPVVAPDAAPPPPPVFAPSPFPLDPNDETPHAWRVTRDLMAGRTDVTIELRTMTRLEDGFVQETNWTATASVDERNPACAAMCGRQVSRFCWPGQTIEVQAHGQLSSTAAAFHASIHAEITVDALPHFTRDWEASFPRHLL